MVYTTYIVQQDNEMRDTFEEGRVEFRYCGMAGIGIVLVCHLLLLK